MSDVLVMRCGICRRRFSGTPPELREVIWPHAEEAHPGRRVAFHGEEFVLSCNCGECKFCLDKAKAMLS
jgi:hypothetical protein